MFKKLLSIFMLCGTIAVQAQDFMLQGWYWDYPATLNGKRYIVNLGDYVPALHQDGFSYIWVPPLSAAAGGTQSNGYDVKDYFDLGEYTNARWGTRSQLDNFVSTCTNNGVNVVADMVFNHRTGGAYENNTAVKGWIENMNATKINAGDQPFPSDRYRCYLPLGGTSGNGAGTYYFKIRSASQHSNFYGKNYLFQAYTALAPPDYATAPISEAEPNGGGDCGQANNTIVIGKQIKAVIDAGGCATDEFAVSIAANQFNPAGDKLYFTLRNVLANGSSANLGDMSDHFAYGIWNGTQDVANQVVFQTQTDFTNLNSQRGGMDRLSFKPNGNPTQLSGDWDAMLFYYDIDQTRTATRDTLFAWTKWMWQNAGIHGFRVDAVKHFPYSFMGDLMDYLHDNNINPGMVVGESFDYSPTSLKSWLDNVNNSMDADTRAAINVRLFDFSLRNALNQAANNASYDVRNVFNSSIVDGGGASGFQVVTFVNNHDFRAGEPTGPITFGKELCYAYILTNNHLGIGSVFYPDFFGDGYSRGRIRAAMEAHKRYIYGATSKEYLNRFSSPFASNFTSGTSDKALIYQMRGTQSGRDVVVAINFGNSPMRVDQVINTASISPGDTLTDILGLSAQPFTIVSGGNSMYIDIPARSFSIWVEGNLTGNLIPVDTSAVPIITSAGSLENHIEIGELKITPNPAHDYFQLEWTCENNCESTRYDLYDINGKLIQSGTLNAVSGENSTQIQLSSAIASGIYIMQVFDGKKLSVGKVVVE